MCTVSWAFSSEGYDLFFNRDEQKSREKAKPPSVGEESGSKYIAPQDCRSHGTWLLVNEFGISIGVLNHSDPLNEGESGRFVSRGLLPLKGVGCSTVKDVVEQIRSIELADFNSFHLLAVGPERKLCLLTWDGVSVMEAHLDAIELPLTTSSYQSEAVVSYRKNLFAKMTADVDDGVSVALKRYHHSHDSDVGPFSVMMNRSDACTLSISHIKVDTDEIQFRYEELVWDKNSESFSNQVVLERNGS
jgi:hypothetical protein